MKTQSVSLVQPSIRFPVDIYQTREGIAKQKKVSLPWFVRDAAERHVASATRQGGEGNV